MSLTDIMSHAGLSMYAQVAMILFLMVFTAIAIRALRPSRRREMEEVARLPLEDDRPNRNEDASSPPGVKRS